MRAAHLCVVFSLHAVTEAQSFTNTSIIRYSFNGSTSALNNGSASPFLFNSTQTTISSTTPLFPSRTNATAFPISINTTTYILPPQTNATWPLLNATITRPPILLPTNPLHPNTTTNDNKNITQNACQAKWEAYESSRLLSPESYDSTEAPITVTSSWSWNWELTTFSTEIYECTQTCGTICYAGSVTTVESTSMYTDIGTRVYKSYADRPRAPLPNCTIPFEECLSLQTSYTSASSSYYSRDAIDPITSLEPIRPYCSACISTSCYFNGMFAMSLYFWPPKTSVSRDYCASEPIGGPVSSRVLDINHTYIPTTTGQYAVVNGVTMYEGNVYISYYEPQVYDNCGKSISRRNKGGSQVITVASEALYSIRKYPNVLAPFPVKWDLIPWPVNFDDFNDPVPWSAYIGQQTCAQSYGTETSQRCSAVKPRAYHPYIMMPPQIRDLDPAWESCGFDEYAAYDPPIALQPGSMFFGSQATPTATGDARPVVTPAMPGQAGGGGMPFITARPGRPQKPNDDDRIHEQMPSLQAPQGPPDTQVAEPTDTPRPELTIGGSVVPVDPTNGLVVKPGITIRPGESPAIVDGTTFTLGSSGVVVIDGKGTTTFAIPPAISQLPVVTVGSSVLPIDSPGRVIIRSGVTLIQGAPPLTIDGTTMSIGTSGVVIIDKKGTSTINIPAVNVATPAVTIGPSVVAFDASGGLIVRAGRTVRPGDPPVAISGTTYSVGPSRVVIIDNRGTSTISFPAPKEYITVGSQTYTLINGELIMGPGLTLSGPGGIVVMGSTTIMLKSGKVEVVTGSETSVIPVKSRLEDAKTDGFRAAEPTVSPKKSAATMLFPSSSSISIAVAIMIHMLRVLV